MNKGASYSGRYDGCKLRLCVGLYSALSKVYEL